jgi:hypothetical protein
MRAAGLLSSRIIVEGVGVLLTAPHEGQHVGRRRFVDSDRSTWEPQIGKVDSEPEPIGGASTFADQREVFGRERVMPDDQAASFDDLWAINSRRDFKRAVKAMLAGSAIKQSDPTR